MQSGVACQFGAQPLPPSTVNTLIWGALSELPAAFLALIDPIIGEIAAAVSPMLINVGTLCASNPVPPAAITLDDVVGDIVPGAAQLVYKHSLLAKLVQSVVYYAFTQNCQCVGNPAGCTSQTIPLSLSTNLLYTGPGLQFVWPASCAGVSSGCTAEYFQWTMGCEIVDVTIWHGTVGSAGQPQLVTHIFDGQGQLYAQSHIMGTAQTVTLRDGGQGFTGPSINLRWDWNIDPTLHPDWTVVIAPHTGQTPGPTGPPPLQNPVLPVIPTKPTLPCDSTTLCNLNWSVVEYINASLGVTNNTNVVVNTFPVAHSYQLGTSHVVAGDGELVVSGDIGALVQITSTDPSTGLDVTDPTRYFDTGFITFGNVDGWQESSRVVHQYQVFTTDLQGVSRIGYSTQKAHWTITELVAA
jgi:hypothetical protein